ncbi:MAG: class I SAM-dependent methyltransferase [Candidatus Bathyarchaeota archaeon]|nr:class I SAM-dependent methyltransferase [Candidatus Bathyarchaeum sp.]
MAGKDKMPQVENPTGFFGKLLARGMAWGHRGFYKNAAKVLDLQPDDSYLEIGFGSGLFIKKYAAHVSRIAGLDYSKDMVNLASSINKGLVKAGKAEFKEGNVSSIPWGDNEFSVVVGIETFFFWPEPKTALKEILRVLAPEGRLVLEMAYNKDDGRDHTKHIEKYNFTLYSGEEMKKLLVESGFSDVSIVYYKSIWIPFKGHVVPKGMVVKAKKGKN